VIVVIADAGSSALALMAARATLRIVPAWFENIARRGEQIEATMRYAMRTASAGMLRCHGSGLVRYLPTYLPTHVGTLPHKQSSKQSSKQPLAHVVSLADYSKMMTVDGWVGPF
jgi:hypothetical protein